MRRFNRFYTRHIGVLTDRYLGQSRPLGEARLLYEIGSGTTDLRELRGRLDLDSGYLTRLLRGLGDDRLVEVTPDPADARARRATLTAAGRREVAEMNRRATGVADDLLSGLAEAQRGELVAALGRAERLLRLGAVRVEQADPAAPAARRCLTAYANELRDRFPEGFADDDLVDPAQAAVFLVAHESGTPVGCAAVRPLDARTGELRHLWVHADARGIGLGRRLLAETERHAADKGLTRLRLGTHEALGEAVALYRSAGYRATKPYGDTAHTHHWFTKRISP
ncbi:MAG TPA: helix-turn-helix domain-containing GNAT family N-acetyltransferase [Actinocatenispora sp.]